MEFLRLLLHLYYLEFLHFYYITLCKLIVFYFLKYDTYIHFPAIYFHLIHFKCIIIIFFLVLLLLL